VRHDANARHAGKWRLQQERHDGNVGKIHLCQSKVVLEGKATGARFSRVQITGCERNLPLGHQEAIFAATSNFDL
jgi:hypothetical protein